MSSYWKEWFCMQGSRWVNEKAGHWWLNSSLTWMRCDPSTRRRKAENFRTPVRVPIFFPRRPRNWESLNSSTQTAREKGFFESLEWKRCGVSPSHTNLLNGTARVRARVCACVRARARAMSVAPKTVRDCDIRFSSSASYFIRNKLCKPGDPAKSDV